MSEPRTAADILRFAVEREEDAAASYAEMAAAAPNEGLRALLLDLRSEEIGHRSRLQSLLARVEAGELPPPVRPVSDLGLTDGLDEPPAGEPASLQDVLIRAARKEARAAALYEGMAARAHDPAARAVLERLAADERGHKLRLETAYETHVLNED